MSPTALSVLYGFDIALQPIFWLFIIWTWIPEHRRDTPFAKKLFRLFMEVRYLFVFLMPFHVIRYTMTTHDPGWLKLITWIIDAWIVWYIVRLKDDDDDRWRRRRKKAKEVIQRVGGKLVAVPVPVSSR